MNCPDASDMWLLLAFSEAKKPHSLAEASFQERISTAVSDCKSKNIEAQILVQILESNTLLIPLHNGLPFLGVCKKILCDHDRTYAIFLLSKKPPKIDF